MIAVLLALATTAMQLAVSTSIQQANYINITSAIPSCQDIDLSSNNGERYLITTTHSRQAKQSTQSKTLYLTSNMVTNIFYPNLTSLCIKTDICQLNTQLHQPYTQFLIQVAENTTDRKQPLIICLSYSFEKLLKPLKKNNQYFYRSSALSIQKSLLSGSFYLFKPYTQSLKLYFDIDEGYPLIIPYICPGYDFQNCLNQLSEKIAQTNQEIASSFYLLLFKIGLFRHESINIDFCHRCFWVVYIDCKIGNCTTRFGIDHSVSADGSSSQPQLVNTSYALKQGRFHSLKYRNSIKQVEYSYSTYGQSQIVYYAALPYQSIYISCNHFPRTYLIKLNQSQMLNFIVTTNSEDRPDPIPARISCTIRADCLTNKSQVYYSNLLLRRADTHKKYLIKITRTHPAIFHYELKQSRAYISIKKCTQAPITLTYYFLPDYDAIKTRTPEQGQQSKQLQDWVTKKQIRMVNKYLNRQLIKSRQPYATNNVIIEIVPDTYSYIQLSIEKEKNVHDEVMKSANNLSFYSEEYAEDENSSHMIKFILKLNISKVLNNQSILQLADKITVIQSQNPDHIQRMIECPHIKFIERHDLNKGIQEPPQLKIALLYIQNDTIIQIRGKSQMKYLSISILVQNQVTYIVLQLKSKISILEKYAWLLALSGATVLLMIIGAVILLATRARKR